MEDGEDSDSPADVLGVFSEHKQAPGCRTYEDVVHDPLVGSGHGTQLLGQREGKQEVVTRQEQLGALLEPSIRSVSLALGAVPIAA
jgi:hypothetical protein